MASRSVSPGGALLRASRVFAIPPPLPRSMGELNSRSNHGSDSATLAHPIHLSITTPQTSLNTGDWGFKRPLPLRSTTKTSTPFIRVDSIDTFEHITEFGSSADHAISLKKWQEMGIAISTPVPNRNRGQYKGDEKKSVFDADIDSIAETDEGLLGKEETRWRFKGPWLAGQTEGEFNTYVLAEVRKRKLEFQQYLRTACAKALTKEARLAATEGVTPAVETHEVTEEQLREFVKSIRESRTVLYKLVRSFLDLAPAPSANEEMFYETLLKSNPGRPMVTNELPPSNSPYAETGPPRTHPSAGLAYSLTNAHTYNHPTFGPQRNQKPVPARVVMPRNAATGNAAAVLGVGGFITDVPRGHDSFNQNNLNRKNSNVQTDSLIPGLVTIELDKVGGSKTYVHPTRAEVDSKGRVVLSVDLADVEAVAVHEGTTDQMLAPAPRSVDAYEPRPFRRAEPGQGGGYGLSMNRESPRRGPPRRTDALSQLTGLL